MTVPMIALLLLVLFGPLVSAGIFARARGASFQTQLGAVTIAYQWPLAVVPPATTLAQYNTYNSVVGTVVAGLAADTQQIITHNLNLPAADISSGFPVVTLTPTTDPFGSSAGWFVASQNPNYTVVQKGTLGTGPTTRFTIASPSSAVR